MTAYNEPIRAVRACIIYVSLVRTVRCARTHTRARTCSEINGGELKNIAKFHISTFDEHETNTLNLRIGR